MFRGLSRCAPQADELELGEWRAHLLGRLHHQIELTADAMLVDLMKCSCRCAFELFYPSDAATADAFKLQP